MEYRRIFAGMWRKFSGFKKHLFQHRETMARSPGNFLEIPVQVPAIRIAKNPFSVWTTIAVQVDNKL